MSQNSTVSPQQTSSTAVEASEKEPEYFEAGITQPINPEMSDKNRNLPPDPSKNEGKAGSLEGGEQEFIV
jgi:hypothetical protein